MIHFYWYILWCNIMLRILEFLLIYTNDKQYFNTNSISSEILYNLTFFTYSYIGNSDYNICKLCLDSYIRKSQ